MIRLKSQLPKVVCYDPVDRVYTVRNCPTRADMKVGRAVPWLQALHALDLRNEYRERDKGCTEGMGGPLHIK